MRGIFGKREGAKPDVGCRTNSFCVIELGPLPRTPSEAASYAQSWMSFSLQGREASSSGPAQGRTTRCRQQQHRRSNLSNPDTTLTNFISWSTIPLMEGSRDSCRIASHALPRMNNVSHCPAFADLPRWSARCSEGHSIPNVPKAVALYIIQKYRTTNGSQDPLCAAKK